MLRLPVITRTTALGQNGTRWPPAITSICIIKRNSCARHTSANTVPATRNPRTFEFMSVFLGFESNAGYGVAAADAGEHFPERVENAVHGVCSRRGVFGVDVLGKHRALGGG